jgi:hypothetical protein
MKKTIARLGLMFFVGAALSLPICAQGDRTYLADIPFAFTMGKAALPAGHYAIQVEPGRSLVKLMNGDGHRSLVLALPGFVYSGSSEQPSLTFAHYGDQYFLSDVRTADSARMIPSDKVEQELQKHAADRNNIVLAMR